MKKFLCLFAAVLLSFSFVITVNAEVETPDESVCTYVYVELPDWLNPDNNYLKNVQDFLKGHVNSMSENDRIAILDVDSETDEVCEIIAGGREKEKEIDEVIEALSYENNEKYRKYDVIYEECAYASENPLCDKSKIYIISFLNKADDLSAEQESISRIRSLGTIMPLYGLYSADKNNEPPYSDDVGELIRESGGEIYEIAEVFSDNPKKTFGENYEGFCPESGTTEVSAEPLSTSPAVTEEAADSGASETTDNVESEDKKSFPVWAIVLIFVVIVLTAAVVVLIVLLVKTSKKESEKESEKEIRTVPAETVPENRVSASADIKQNDVKPVKLRLNIDIARADKRNTDITVTDRIVIGKSSNCDVCVADEKMSSRHFCIEYIGGEPYLKNLVSKNNLLLNGFRVSERHKLYSGDKIIAGFTDITIMIIGR